MNVTVASAPGPDWDAFVATRPDAAPYLQAGWSQFAADVFHFQAYFLEAREQGRLTGVLPMVRQKSLLFGDFLTSIPFFNFGGALAESPATAVKLMDKARDVANELKCSYLELRDTAQHDVDWQVRTDKVSMLLPLPATYELLEKQIGSKLRSQTRRADRDGATTRIGGAELIDAFYDVFSRNMHELGTPVYPKRFFAELVARFREQCVLVVVDRNGTPAAAGFVVIAGGWAEIPWAACRADAKPAGFNMKLYAEVLREVCRRGCSSFDFGRSTVDSGTYRFKAQWGAQPRQLYWYRWQKEAGLASGAPQERGRLMSLATRAWQRMPLRVANTLGPLISPGLPW